MQINRSLLSMNRSEILIILAEKEKELRKLIADQHSPGMKRRYYEPPLPADNMRLMRPRCDSRLAEMNAAPALRHAVDDGNDLGNDDGSVQHS